LLSNEIYGSGSALENSGTGFLERFNDVLTSLGDEFARLIGHLCRARRFEDILRIRMCAFDVLACFLEKAAYRF
jgi:hypothetical protein